jgi:hypothetical protein
MSVVAAISGGTEVPATIGWKSPAVLGVNRTAAPAANAAPIEIFVFGTGIVFS